MGVEIILNNFKKIHLPSDEGQRVIQDLKEQIRNRKDPLDRAEHWEAITWETNVYEKYPDKPGRVYSYDRQWKLLWSRMTDEERSEYAD